MGEIGYLGRKVEQVEGWVEQVGGWVEQVGLGG